MANYLVEEVTRIELSYKEFNLLKRLLRYAHPCPQEIEKGYKYITMWLDDRCSFDIEEINLLEKINKEFE
jgi:hypothetical protein